MRTCDGCGDDQVFTVRRGEVVLCRRCDRTAAIHTFFELLATNPLVVTLVEPRAIPQSVVDQVLAR